MFDVPSGVSAARRSDTGALGSGVERTETVRRTGAQRATPVAAVNGRGRGIAKADSGGAGSAGAAGTAESGSTELGREECDLTTTTVVDTTPRAARLSARVRSGRVAGAAATQ